MFVFVLQRWLGLQPLQGRHASRGWLWLWEWKNIWRADTGPGAVCLWPEGRSRHAETPQTRIIQSNDAALQKKSQMRGLLFFWRLGSNLTMFRLISHIFLTVSDCRSASGWFSWSSATSWALPSMNPSVHWWGTNTLCYSVVSSPRCCRTKPTSHTCDCPDQI